MTYRIAARPKLFAHGLHDTQICEILDQGDGGCVLLCKVDVGLVYDDDAFELFKVQQRFYGFKGDERSGWVAGRTEEYQLYGWVGADCFLHLIPKYSVKKLKNSSTRTLNRPLSPPSPSSPLYNSSGTLTIPTSLTCAQTAYIPYVGGVVKIFSLPPGTTHTLISISITSSLPTPKTRILVRTRHGGMRCAV